jgi:hypothetical protein
MSALARFLHDALYEGRLVLASPPDEAATDRQALAVLRRAFDAHALSIAGAPLAFDEKLAFAAARLLQRAAWYYLNPGFTIEKPETLLSIPRTPAAPEHHLSGDLVLRLMPTLYRRAKALMPNDALPERLEQVLREWPLSGVLADIREAPLTPIEFGHVGLDMLYAERLALHDRAGWFPSGKGLEYVELIWQDLGRNVAVLPALAGPSEMESNEEFAGNDA